MGFEVEIKAHVTNPEKVKARMASPLSFVEKDDVYWGRKGEELYLFRTRRQVANGTDEKVICTFKERNMTGLIEANGEYEFGVEGSQWREVQLFFEKLGYQKLVSKHKKGYVAPISYSGLPDGHAELWDVGRLGWFLEIEFLLEDQSLIGKAREALCAILGDFGIASQEIEPRRYTEMLEELKAGMRPE